jgi:hypothetical protein
VSEKRITENIIKRMEKIARKDFHNFFSPSNFIKVIKQKDEMSEADR